MLFGRPRGADASKERRMKKLLGYILAIPLLVFSILTGIGILAIFVAMSMKGMPTSLAAQLQ
jgi:ABC-type spermidine/putrescine transport system permease subunit II